MRTIQSVSLCTALLCASLSSRCDAQSLSHKQGRAALLKAVTFFTQHVSAGGGYLWQYSADLSQREGENKASATQAWVQPPGTPSVGDAFLEAWLLTREPALLEAAKNTAYALTEGQLISGGWDYRIEFDPKRRSSYAYRSDFLRDPATLSVDARNVTTLDDDTTQSAFRFLIRMDSALKFRDAKIHSAVRIGLACLEQAQYPNGAWPQRYSELVIPDKFSVKPASYPATWPREHPKLDYRSYYTFNDNTLADLIDTFFLAGEVYENDRYTQAALRAGQFIIRAQMPEPQPAWAQQYNLEMHPAWARRFEPPAVTGGESQGVIRTLLTLFRRTGDERFLKPIPAALDYLERSTLPNGQLARFYELKTNRPLYFTTDYVLTYDDSDLPTHYGFKVGSNIERLRDEFKKAKTAGRTDTPLWTLQRKRPGLSSGITASAAALINQMDERGAWTEDGQLRARDNNRSPQRVITTRTFARNLRTLSRFVAASQKSR